MVTKTCKSCGYTVDREKRTRTCPECGTVFDENYCVCCGCYCTPPDLIKGSYCKECYDTLIRKPGAEKRSKDKWNNNIMSIWNDWQSKISKVPQQYPPLTEAQWLETCKHFNGCAFCGSDDISARGYFVPFNMNGRYCDWNIVPLCEKCAMTAQNMSTAINYNPFKSLARKDLERFYSIINYLGDKLIVASTGGSICDEQTKE